MSNQFEITYRCCEHCLNDPRYHEDYPADSHDTWCSLPGCVEGKKTVTFDSETGLVL